MHSPGHLVSRACMYNEFKHKQTDGWIDMWTYIDSNAAVCFCIDA